MCLSIAENWYVCGIVKYLVLQNCRNPFNVKVCVVGTGYVGLVTGTCLAEMGNNVTCIDNDQQKIQRLEAGEVPIYEPGLEELIKSNTQEGRLTFSTNLTTTVKDSAICIIAVGTPQGDDGSADLSAVFAVAEAIAKAMNGYKVVVTKSTVPVGTADRIKGIVAQHTSHPFSVVSNPEFLKQGAAVDDFLKPDRVVIGSDDVQATELMRELYAPFLRTGNPVILMDVRSAEMTKYVANAFLAAKISFINEMSNLCERVGADVSQVRVGISSDQRIGPQFLFPGLGYGGSCFPKDVKALMKTATDYGFDSPILKAVDDINQNQRQVYLNKVLSHFNHDVAGKTFAVWGLAFKPRTDDMREAPSVTIIQALLERGAHIQAFDPKAVASAKRLFGDKLVYTTNNYDALQNADALLLLTEWNEFRRPDFDRMKDLLKQPVIFDGRNQYDAERMTQRGFHYECMGRNLTQALQPVGVS
jgi:UDPglucose 6-dehydrogenase